MSTIREQIAAKRAESRALTERVNARIQAGRGRHVASAGGRGGFGATGGSESAGGDGTGVLADRTLMGQIKKAHKTGKLDISSFELDRIPVEVYTRLLQIPTSDLSNPPPPLPRIDPSAQAPPSRTHDQNLSHAQREGSREAVFGQPVLSMLDRDWGESAEVISFKASDNAIEGIERELGLFGGIKSLDLSHNLIRGLPDSCADLLRLTTVDLSHNALTSLPPSLLLLPALQVLDLSYNHISSLDTSQPIQPSDEGLTYGAGFLTTSFGRMSLGSRPLWPQLTSLNLSHNELGNEDLACFRGSKLPLRKLDLSGNKLLGEVQADDIGLGKSDLPRLENLILDDNKRLVSFDRPGAEVQVSLEGCNLTTNSSSFAAAEGDARTSRGTGIPRSSNTSVPDPDLTITYKTCPAASFDSEPLAIEFDLYLPPSPPVGSKGHPLVIWFHGGGLLQGNKENLPPHFRRLPSHPFPSAVTGSTDHIAVISPNYRLAPQSPILDILGDVDDLLTYIRTKLNAKLKASAEHSGHTIDTGRMCLSGGSAGGYLALIAGLQVPKSRMIPDDQVGGYRGERGGGEGIKCLAPFYPITDLTDPFWATKTDPVPWYGKSVPDSAARPHLDLKSPPVATAVSGGPRSILYMYMLQHALFPSLLFMKQRPVGSGLDAFRPEPIHMSLPHRLALTARTSATSKMPVYLIYGSADDKVQPMDRSIEALESVVRLEVERLEGEDHQFDEDPGVECDRFREWLGRELI